jgi:hypothetical protein
MHPKYHRSHHQPCSFYAVILNAVKDPCISLLLWLLPLLLLLPLHFAAAVTFCGCRCFCRCRCFCCCRCFVAAVAFACFYVVILNAVKDSCISLLLLPLPATIDSIAFALP